jgi:uncharacterized protein involved in exopolysaccharide biosynthesis
MSQQSLVVIDSSKNRLLMDLADRLFRKSRRILALFAALNICTAIYLVCGRRSYQAEMQFLVNNMRADAVVTPESTNGQIARTYVDESVIATEIQLLSNRELLRDVVRKCKLADGSSAAAVEKAVKDLQIELKVSPVLKANMLKASYSSSDPNEAAGVLRTLADGYLNEHLKVHSASGTYEFFDRQARFYEQRLKELQSKLAEFRGQRDIVLLGQQKDLNLRKMVDLEATLKETEAAYRENEQRIQTLRQQLGKLTPRITTQARKLPNQYSVERLNTMLVELQNRRTELLTKFRPDDRLVQQVDQQIADTRRAMEGARKLTATEEATDVNPLRQSLEAELAKATLNAAGLRVRTDSLAKQINGYKHSLGMLQNSTAEDDQILRDIKEAEDNFFLYSKKREEARIGEAMDRQKIANVVLVEPPHIPALPKPKITGALVATYVFDCLMILAYAFLVGAVENKVYTPWELEGITGLPVLASVSYRRLQGGPRVIEGSATVEAEQ